MHELCLPTIRWKQVKNIFKFKENQYVEDKKTTFTIIFFKDAEIYKEVINYLDRDKELNKKVINAYFDVVKTDFRKHKKKTSHDFTSNITTPKAEEYLATKKELFERMGIYG